VALSVNAKSPTCHVAPLRRSSAAPPGAPDDCWAQRHPANQQRGADWRPARPGPMEGEEVEISTAHGYFRHLNIAKNIRTMVQYSQSP